MRHAMTLAAAAWAAVATTGAHAEDWCGYAASAKSMVECGYSSVTECESTTGKGGMCFVDPERATLTRPAHGEAAARKAG